MFEIAKKVRKIALLEAKGIMHHASEHPNSTPRLSCGWPSYEYRNTTSPAPDDAVSIVFTIGSLHNGRVATLDP